MCTFWKLDICLKQHPWLWFFSILPTDFRTVKGWVEGFGWWCLHHQFAWQKHTIFINVNPEQANAPFLYPLSIPEFPADLVTFTEETLMENFTYLQYSHFGVLSDTSFRAFKRLGPKNLFKYFLLAPKSFYKGKNHLRN